MQTKTDSDLRFEYNDHKRALKIDLVRTFLGPLVVALLLGVSQLFSGGDRPSWLETTQLGIYAVCALSLIISSAAFGKSALSHHKLMRAIRVEQQTTRRP